jgi:hypothetical protein
MAGSFMNPLARPALEDDAPGVGERGGGMGSEDFRKGFRMTMGVAVALAIVVLVLLAIIALFVMPVSMSVSTTTGG